MVRALIAVAAVIVGLIATLIVLDGREGGSPGGEAAGGTDEATDPATAAADGLPEDYLCHEYDVAAYEDFAGGPVNEEYTLSDGLPAHQDVIGEMIYCVFMVGWPADDDGVELTVEVHTEPDRVAAEESLGWDHGNWESADGTVEDYSGPEGEGFVYRSEEESGLIRVALLNGTSVATASLSRIPEGRTVSEARAIMLDLIAQAWDVNAENPR